MTDKSRKFLRAIPVIFAAAIFCLGIASCDNQVIEVYQVPKENAAQQIVSDGLVPPAPANPAQWKKPADWEEQPLSEMRVGSFKFTDKNGSSADVSITAFPGEAGGLASNVNRWRAQVQLPPLPENELEQTIRRTDLDGTPVSLVDISTPVNSAKPSRIIGAVLERPDQTWFVKMTGEPALLEKQRPIFLDFVNSFQFAQHSDPAATGQTPAQSETKPRSTNDQ
jgi:hypothetical protein